MLNKIKNFFRPEPKVTFQATLPGVDKIMPIIPAKEYRPKWLAAARADFSKAIGGGYPTRPINSPHKCPGIVDLLNTGWIVRAWQDMTIETNGDGENFQWKSTVGGLDFRPIGDIGFLPGAMLLDYLPRRIDTLNTIIKFQAPWLVDVPKGYSLLFVPMLYSDDGRFTNAPGILDTELDRQLNIQVFWHALNSTEVIRAGTPLAHLVLIPNELAVEMEVKPYHADIKAEQYSEMYKSAVRYLGDYKKKSDQ
jgi:hypothetical protein